MSQKEVTSDSQPLEPDAAKEKFGFGASWLPLMLALPPLVYYMWICMVDHGGAFYIPTSIDELLALVKRVPAPTRASTLFVVLWFVMIRPQMKKAKEQQKMVSELAKGDEVVTQGGIAGRIAKVGENYLSLEVAEGKEGAVVIAVQKGAVGTLLPKGTLKNL